MYSLTHKRKIGIQVGYGAVDRKEIGVQNSHSMRSYGRRKNETGHLTYDELLRNRLWTKDYAMEWLKKEKLLATNSICDICHSDMMLRDCSDRSDGYVWECRRQIRRKRHRTEKSIREGSWFEESNLSIEEVVKFTYCWTQGLEQWQIKQQLNLGSHTAVD